MKKLSETAVVLAVALVLAVMTAFIYWPTVNHGFLEYDDKVYVTDNQRVLAGITRDGVVWALRSTYATNWHPVTWVSHMLDVELFGMDAGKHHLVNLLFHLLNTILLFLILKGMTGTLWRSALVAALFGVHPLHVESVAWVAERKDVLSAFFWFLTMGAYFWYTRKPNVGRYLVVALNFSLGLMAKPMLVTLPFVLLLLDYWPLKRLEWGGNKDTGQDKLNNQIPFGKIFLEKLPLLSMSAASAVITYHAQKTGGAVIPVESLPFGSRLSNAVWSYGRYIGKMLWPTGLSAYYPHPRYGLSLWSVGVTFLLLLIVTILVTRWLRRYPYAAVGWFWYLGTLVPVIGLVQVGAQAIADRYTYIPLIGLFIMFAWGVNDLLPEWRHMKKVLWTAAVVALAVLVVMGQFQVGMWRDDETLFSHALEVTTENWVAHNNLGFALYEKGRIDESISHYLAALEINPLHPLVLNNLGNAHFRRGDIKEALASYRKSISHNPDYAEAYNNLGATLLDQGEVDESIVNFQRAVRLNPDFTDARFNLGVALEMVGRRDEAILQYREILKLTPEDIEVSNRLADLLRQQNNSAGR